MCSKMTTKSPTKTFYFPKIHPLSLQKCAEVSIFQQAFSCQNYLSALYNPVQEY